MTRVVFVPAADDDPAFLIFADDAEVDRHLVRDAVLLSAADGDAARAAQSRGEPPYRPKAEPSVPPPAAPETAAREPEAPSPPEPPAFVWRDGPLPRFEERRRRKGVPPLPYDYAVGFALDNPDYLTWLAS